MRVKVGGRGPSAGQWPGQRLCGSGSGSEGGDEGEGEGEGEVKGQDEGEVDAENCWNYDHFVAVHVYEWNSTAAVIWWK